MKKYRIIKEFPLHKVGDVFETKDNVFWKCINNVGSTSDYIPMELKQLVEEGYLEEVDERDERWKPEEGEVYFYIHKISPDIEIEDTYWLEYGFFDKERWKLGNCFKTKKEAQEVRDAIAELLARRRK